MLAAKFDAGKMLNRFLRSKMASRVANRANFLVQSIVTLHSRLKYTKSNDRRRTLEYSLSDII